MRLAERVVVARSLEDVWSFFLDIQNLPKWDRGVARVQVTSGDGRVGTTFDTFGWRGRGRMSYEVTRVVPPHEHEAVTRSGYFKLARWNFTLEPMADSTGVTCLSEFSLRLRYLWLAPIVALVGGKAIRRDLMELKRVVESEEHWPAK